MGGVTVIDRATEPTPTRRTRLLRDNLSVATGTAVGRVTGFVKVLALFVALEGGLRDAYQLANNAPNIIFELILGGVLTATLVPLFTDDLLHGDDEATSAVVSTALVALVAVTGLTFVVSPGLIWLYSLNHAAGVSPGELRSVGTNLAFFFAPQVFFYGAMALGSALLNARRRFFAAAWAPVLENLIVIAMLLTIPLVFPGHRDLERAARDGGLRAYLGIGTTLSIVVMAVVLLPVLRRAGVHIRLRPSLRHPAVRRAMRLSGWTIGYVVANQVAAFVVLVLAKPGTGNVTDYQTAFTFFQLPHGLLAVSLMTTFQPDLARSASVGDEPGFNRRLLLGLRLLGLVVIPAAVGYLVVTHTFVDGMRHAHVTLARFDLLSILPILGGFALGLVGFSAYLFILRAFYARTDTRTPFYLNLVENALNIVFALLLVGRFGVMGLAIAYALAYSVAAVVSFVVLTRRLDDFDVRGLVDTLVRLLGAAAVMAFVAWVIAGAVQGAGWAPVLLSLLVTIGAGIATYAAAVLVLRVPEQLGGLGALSAGRGRTRRR